MQQEATATATAQARDEELWRGWMTKALAGDRTAYDALLHALGDVIEAYLRSRFGPLPMLEDCVQECLLAVHQARHTYDPRRPFRPWFFTIVRHKTIDMLRRQVKREDGELPGVEEASPAVDPADQLETGRALDALKPQFREALLLTKLEGLTVPEAADRCGVSESAMKARVNRALKAVRKYLDSDSAHGY